VIDVGSDHLPRLVEGLELVAPDAAFFEVANHDSMNAEPLSVPKVGVPGRMPCSSTVSESS
jgi:hypothetical protein